MTPSPKKTTAQPAKGKGSKHTASRPNSNDQPPGDDEQVASEIDRELEETAKELAVEATPERPVNYAYGDTWKKADELVAQLKPVPFVMLVPIRGVFCRPPKSAPPSPYSFSSVSPLIAQAALDPTLGSGRASGARDSLSIVDAVEAIGADVAAAVCFVHSVCRRIAFALPERIWRPIIDDALLRTQIGFHIGAQLDTFGHGRGMLAGFAGRCGLAIQIGSGDMNQAAKALEMLAHGIPLRDVGLRIYGCEPLQVSAIALAAGGCGREAALGTASYAFEGKDMTSSAEQMRWLAAFAIAEELRMGHSDNVEDRCWYALNFNDVSKSHLKKQVQRIHREGHSLGWITLPQLTLDLPPKKDRKS